MFTKTWNGVGLPEQRDYLRELIHIKFPNTAKLVVDTMGAGAGLPSMFYEPWEWVNPTTKEAIEFPPLVKDNDEEGMRLYGAVPLIRAITATNSFNVEYYPYMKNCFEDRSLRILPEATDIDAAYKEGSIKPEEYALYIETDLLIQELSNLRQEFTERGAITYSRIIRTRKRDRATSLMYGLSYVCELETLNRQDLYRENFDDYEMLMNYSYL